NNSLAHMAKALIEDNPGFKVFLATTGAAAKELIKEHNNDFTAALADLNLPDAPNGEIVPVIQAAGIPVIVLTGFFGDELRTQMLELGIVDYVLKKNISAYEYACKLVQRIHRNRSTKVLIVEDSVSTSLLLKRRLEIQCLNVVSAGNGREALERLNEHPDIKLVLTDYNMPEMDGFELCQQLRSRHSKEQLTIIGLSNSSDERISAHFLKSGANDFISKPYTYEELLCRVNQNLDYHDQIETIREAANRDYLTNLYNRRYFFNEGKQIHLRAKFLEAPLTVAMIDIDHFKKINDTFGHDAGDIALKHIAELMNNAFENDLLARFGGEEFCLICNGDSALAYQRLDEFRRTVANSLVKTPDHEFSFSVSIGLNQSSEDCLDAIINAADANLLRAKEQGRNQVVATS
ncbi:MAG: GGDEF domain-containing response regulator, partial [Spongiibacteraceae bacterium]